MIKERSTVSSLVSLLTCILHLSVDQLSFGSSNFGLSWVQPFLYNPSSTVISSGCHAAVFICVSDALSDLTRVDNTCIALWERTEDSKQSPQKRMNANLFPSLRNSLLLLLTDCLADLRLLYFVVLLLSYFLTWCFFFLLTCHSAAPFVCQMLIQTETHTETHRSFSVCISECCVTALFLCLSLIAIVCVF